MSLRINETTIPTYTKSNSQSVMSNPGFEPLLQFKNSEELKTVSDEKVLAWAENKTDKTPKEKTEDFKTDVMKMLNISDPKKAKSARYHLDNLVENIQILNGVRKQILLLKGSPEQIKNFNDRINEKIEVMNESAGYVTKYAGLNVSVVEDPETNQYKLCVDDKLLKVPNRKVKIVLEEIENDSDELMPKIAD